MPPRPTPFDLVFRDIADSVFPQVRNALEASGQDPRDRDAFLMAREVAALLHELRPDEGLGEQIDQLVALVHHAYLFWTAGRITVPFERPQLEALLTTPGNGEGELSVPEAYYAQVPERQVWAQLQAGYPHEPLDGCFVDAAPGEALRVLGVFSVHTERAGFSVAEAAGPAPVRLTRIDNTPLFAPTLPGAEAAGLFSITGAEELLELGWRTRLLAAERMPTAARASSTPPENA